MIELLITSMLSIILQAQSPDATRVDQHKALQTASVVLEYISQEQDRINFRLTNNCVLAPLSDKVVLRNDKGYQYSFEDPIINRERILTLLLVDFYVAEGVLPQVLFTRGR